MNFKPGRIHRLHMNFIPGQINFWHMNFTHGQIMYLNRFLIIGTITNLIKLSINPSTRPINSNYISNIEYRTYTLISNRI